MEKLRQILIQWNIAPIGLVIFLATITYWMVSVLLKMPPCEDGVNTVYIALSGLITAMSGILYKMYNSMQKDRKEDEDE